MPHLCPSWDPAVHRGPDFCRALSILALKNPAMESPEGFAPLQLGPLAWGKLIEWIQTPLSVWGTLRQWTQTPLLSTSVEVGGGEKVGRRKRYATKKGPG